MSVEARGNVPADSGVAVRMDESAVARMAAGVAHELRNPLAVILARVQLLRLGLKRGSLPDPDKLSRVLVTIEEQAIRASKIIENLSIFARPRAPELTSVDLAEAVTQVVGMLHERLQTAGVGAEVEVPAQCSIVADRGQLDAVLAQLLTNALEAMPSGGRVVIRARRGGGAVEISVRDTGPGVAAHDASRIFEPFFSTKPGAAGLGLCAAQTIAESHGGSVRLVAGGGPGAEFVLRLPAAE
jgi:signal transduction histidine kinase